MISIYHVIQFFTERGNEIIPALQTTFDEKIIGPRAIDVAGPDHITFISSKLANNFEQLISNTGSKVVLLEDKILDDYPREKLLPNRTYIISNNPKKDIIDFSKQFLTKKKVEKTRIHPSAIIGDNVIIGEQVDIGSNVTIEDNCLIGDRCLIGPGTVIKSQTQIGDDVWIGSCNVIGGDGFGYVKNEVTGQYDHFPHYGGVKIMNNVHIGNNTCIDRGSLKNTIIKEGVRIDNLVHIAHNVEVGRNSIIIACSMIAGSVIIEDNCWVAPGSNVRNGITLGERSVIGLGSTVTKNVEEDQTVMGNPAISIEDFLILRDEQKKILLDHKAKHND